MYIEVKNLSKSYQQKEKVFEALKDVSFEVEKGEFICLLGPSGCGKSTLLNVMAGFEKAEGGSVIIDGKHVTEPSVKHVTIFQNYGRKFRNRITPSFYVSAPRATASVAG